MAVFTVAIPNWQSKGQRIDALEAHLAGAQPCQGAEFYNKSAWFWQGGKQIIAISCPDIEGTLREVKNAIKSILGFDVTIREL